MNKYINREISWLDFNHRVLLEAKDDTNNLKNKFKFISIFSSNLDEFVMVRMGSLQDQINAGYEKLDIAGYSPKEQLELIHLKVKKLCDEQEQILSSLIEESKAHGLILNKLDELTKEELKFIDEYFLEEVYPILTPLAVDNTRIFPLLMNKAIYFGINVEIKNKEQIALLQMPSILPRFYKISETSKKIRYVLLEDIIKRNIKEVFQDVKINSISTFRITRNGDLEIDEDEVEDLLSVIENSIFQRRWGQVIRLEVKKGFDPFVIDNLLVKLNIDASSVHINELPLDKTSFISLKGSKSSTEFQTKEFKPRKFKNLKKKNLFDVASQRDLLFHFPYDSFDYIVDFIKKASLDENVLAIKQTLYRVNGNSEIIKALSYAAKKGKQVTVLVELKARFDEENNIVWARQLEKTGANVIYGVPGLKTHSKLLLVVRKQKDGIKRYVNIATGNYNAVTAKLYTDLSLLTSREDIAKDASELFNLISGYGNKRDMTRLIYAPLKLRERLYSLIDNEINYAKKGKKAKIKIVINSLFDKEMIDKLYEASTKGVKIDLVVRGICSLVPGVKGLSENIKVKSILGDFLEHSRIFYFKNAQPDKLFIGSADLMQRNLDRRVELITPIIDKTIQKRIYLILKLLIEDNQKSWVMDNKGVYKKEKADKNKINAQNILREIKYSNDEEFIEEIEKILSFQS